MGFPTDWGGPPAAQVSGTECRSSDTWVACEQPPAAAFSRPEAQLFSDKRFVILTTLLASIAFLAVLVFGIVRGRFQVEPPSADQAAVAERVAPIGTVRLQESGPGQAPAGGASAASGAAATPGGSGAPAP